MRPIDEIALMMPAAFGCPAIVALLFDSVLDLERQVKRLPALSDFGPVAAAEGPMGAKLGIAEDRRSAKLTTQAGRGAIDHAEER